MYAQIIVTGILVSLVFSYFTELSPAGLIVPGYIALNFGSPFKLLLTLAVVMLTILVYRLISRFTILYGQRRFAVMVLISIAISYLISLLPIPVAGVGVIGYLIPGIIAKECERQGIIRTLAAMAAASAITAGIALLFGAKLF
ncbi:MAG: poly-gamma-glutamate biosynthesis protein PgsC [Lachnospiraceae bacterium]|nr:poly-gamma-glutamate biosynthesis protein PgsC [Lachnospiraceae bacterium]